MDSYTIISSDSESWYLLALAEKAVIVNSDKKSGDGVLKVWDWHCLIDWVFSYLSSSPSFS